MLVRTKQIDMIGQIAMVAAAALVTGYYFSFYRHYIIPKFNVEILASFLVIGYIVLAIWQFLSLLVHTVTRPQPRHPHRKVMECIIFTYLILLLVSSYAFPALAVILVLIWFFTGSVPHTWYMWICIRELKLLQQNKPASFYPPNIQS